MNTRGSSIDRLIDAARLNADLLSADPPLLVVARRQLSRRPAPVELGVAREQRRARITARLRSEAGSVGADLLSVIVGLSLMLGGVVAYQPAKAEIDSLIASANQVQPALSVCPDSQSDGLSVVAAAIQSPLGVVHCVLDPVIQSENDQLAQIPQH